MYRGASAHSRVSVCVRFVAVDVLRPVGVFSSPLTAHHKSGFRHLEVEWPDLVSTFLAFRHLEVEWPDLLVARSTPIWWLKQLKRHVFYQGNPRVFDLPRAGRTMR